MPRPEGLALRAGGAWRKRWRYVGAFDDHFMLCAAVVEVGPGRQAFWALWDRKARSLRDRTRPVLPLVAPSEVTLDGPRVAVRSGEVRIDLELGDAQPIEVTCPADGGAFTWTRKAAGMDVRGTVGLGRLEHEFAGRGVDDVSAGHARHRTSWLWSAGVGSATDGRAVAWNLVSGINDPPAGSERAIWVDGVPSEPGPVGFEGLESIGFGDGSRMAFEPEAGRARTDSVPLVFRSDYEAPFGSFSGSLDGIELEGGLGVMERHDAVW